MKHLEQVRKLKLYASACVVSQNPAGGTLGARGSVVTLAVARFG